MESELIPKVIAGQEWLDGVADPLQKAVHASLENAPGVKNALHGIWLGHPLHPALTDIPVGAWTVAMVLDALETLGGREELGAGADAAIAVGLIGAVGSAVTGLADFSDTDGAGKKVGVVHGVLNVVATGLFTASWILRKSRRRSTGRALSMLGYGVALASAYLGGHLVLSEQVGVDHTATADAGKPAHFVRVIAEASLREDKPARVVADGVAIVLVKREGAIYAISETCPHLGGPLSEGKLVGNAIQCPWHGSQLALDDGHVVNGPTAFPARCYDVRVRDGHVEVRARGER